MRQQMCIRDSHDVGSGAGVQVVLFELALIGVNREGDLNSALGLCLVDSSDGQVTNVGTFLEMSQTLSLIHISHKVLPPLDIHLQIRDLFLHSIGHFVKRCV